MIKVIKDNDIIYAKIVRAGHNTGNTEFFTEKSDELQLGIVQYKKDYKTGAHYHNHLKTKTTKTDEILMFQRGSARIDFYNDKGAYIKSANANTGDIVILYKGGHNIVYLEDTKLFMIKPGAYDPETDKTRIIGANNLELTIEND